MSRSIPKAWERTNGTVTLRVTPAPASTDAGRPCPFGLLPAGLTSILTIERNGK